MGNSNTKESRGDPRAHRAGLAPDAFASSQSQPSDRLERPASGSRTRVSRPDLGNLLGITTSHSGSGSQPPYERRETKQEREARRLERERQARIAERERSLKEEHVDGGYLVTLGTYVGPEDFNKQIVRQLQIERKVAPFWRGLPDFDENWTEPQIIAAARGLPVPPPDQTPTEELIPRPLPLESPASSSQNLNNLTVAMGGRSLSVASDKSASNGGSALPSPAAAGPARGNSPFKPRAKALAAALSGSSRNGSTTEIAPREIQLPHDPFVNGQPLEVFLYKNGSECPICFLYYPPYLNHTRCCDQPICSECFVQIKRPDPHYPESHGDHHEDNPTMNPEEQAGLLISEPACCPYCQQPEFGITYEPPPFRRGLAYSITSALSLGAMGTAMSSSSSLNSTLSPSSLNAPNPFAGGTAPHTGRRRTQSLSANDPSVITTDKIRPDWSTKLATQRAHVARRAAAATALHTAAFLMGNSENRTFRVGRFSRRNTGSGSGGANNNGGESSPGHANNSDGAEAAGPAVDPGARGSSSRVPLANEGRRSRMEDLEELMFREALRQSLATEEERRRKSEKEERKEAKRREKEERKAAKAAKRQGSDAGPYSAAGSGHSSASGSSLSLSGLGAGRRRGNSGASSLRVEASVASAMAVGSSGASTGNASPVNAADKGKAVDRGVPSQPEGAASQAGQAGQASQAQPQAATSTARPIPSPQQRVGPSHLRQMSSASSVSSSLPDSAAGSYQNPSHLQDPRASGLSLGSRSGASDDGGEHGDDRDPSTSAEPMFNFSSLAEMVGVQLEGEHAGRRLSAIGHDALTGKGEDADQSGSGASGAEADATAEPHPAKEDEAAAAHGEHVELANGSAVPEESTSKLGAHVLTPPEVLITPETPALVDGHGEEFKRLGYETTAIERPHQVTQ